MKEFFVPIWKETLRVLKPGAFSFVMSAPRSDVQTVMVQTLQEAGFDISFTPIYWAYATGFPKAMNMGKSVTKRGDIDKAKKLDGSYAGYQPKPAVEVVIVAMKPLGKKKGYVDQALDNGKGVTWLDDCRIPFAGMNDIPQGGYGDMKVGYGKPGETQPMSKDYEQFLKDNVAGHQKFIEKRKDEMYGGGWDKPARKSKSDYEKYVSDKNNKENYSEERGWDKWGVEEEKPKRKTTKRQPRTDHNVFKQSGFKSEENDTAEASPLGRFAANLLISDNVLDTGKKTKSSGGRSYQNTNDMYSGGWARDDLGTNENPGKGDVGDFSRFYSLDEWWKFRMSRLPEEIQRTFPFLIVPKASKSEKNMGLENNLHPTVKPIDLMSYLVVLGSRKDDVVLDPFSGSGTTGIACVFSERNYILIEREKEYFNIMEARIKKAKNPADLVQHEWF
jgi:hypothetical protein